MTREEALEHVLEPMREILSNSDSKMMVEAYSTYLRKGFSFTGCAIADMIDRAKDFVIEFGT